MDDVLAALDAQQQELGAVVDRLRPDQLTLPSRCPGWSVADVLLHLAQTNEMAVASVEGRVVAWMHDAAQGLPPGGHVDDWAGALVAGERGAPDQAVARWRASTAAQLAAFTTCPPHARLTWVSGELAARTLATTRLAEAWIHTVDAVVAVGRPVARPPRRV
ncbi:MAG TPA: maleylpyruvate isomerase family mycothiol-dependent enzyme, partial [Acidimicrobiales bacterium]|nr:maleylpyruvate isomerase family mycothiol-dependent enzyme [Acidimicrobiales bacterium]